MDEDILCICGHPVSIHKNHKRGYVGYCHARHDNNEWCECEGFDPQILSEGDFLEGPS